MYQISALLVRCQLTSNTTEPCSSCKCHPTCLTGIVCIRNMCMFHTQKKAMLAWSQVKIMMDGQLLSVSTFHRIHLLGQEQPLTFWNETAWYQRVDHSNIQSLSKWPSTGSPAKIFLWSVRTSLTVTPWALPPLTIPVPVSFSVTTVLFTDCTAAHRHRAQ